MAEIKKTKKEEVKESAAEGQLTKTKEVKKVETADSEKLLSGTSAAKENKKKSRKEKRKDKLGFNWFFWISFIIILIPVCYFVYLLYSASQESHVPIIGTRLETNIVNKIEDEQLDKVRTSLKSIEGVEGCEVTLIVETMRVSLDVSDDLTGEQIQELNVKAYEAINEIIPIDEYFSPISDKKQYDLGITSYTNLKSEDFIIVMLTKNAQMNEYINQIVTDAKNPEEVAELEDLIRQEEEENNQSSQQETETPAEEQGEQSTENNA